MGGGKSSFSGGHRVAVLLVCYWLYMISMWIFIFILPIYCCYFCKSTSYDISDVDNDYYDDKDSTAMVTVTTKAATAMTKTEAGMIKIVTAIVTATTTMTATAI